MYLLKVTPNPYGMRQIINKYTYVDAFLCSLEQLIERPLNLVADTK